MEMVLKNMNVRNNDKNSFLVIIIFTLLFFNIVFSVFHSKTGYQNGYKKGQIDAINGIIKYELVEQEDKSFQWRRIE